MNKSELLMDIELEIKTLQAHLKRVKRSDYPLNILDVDMLKEKVRMIYDRMIELEALVQYGKAPETIKEEERIEQPEVVSSIVRGEADPLLQSDKTELKEEKTIDAFKKDKGAADATNAPETEERMQFRKEERETPMTKDNKVQQVAPEDKTKEKQPEEEVTPLDLFSDTNTKTLGDILAPSDEPTVAERIQKSQITDLRQAIGINEKFQILNGLFNGDLTKYNKAIDELNSFSGLDGAKTYLFELHVEYQWADDHPALILLNELLERKFS